MYLASVIPIIPRSPENGLSYYSTKKVVAGNVVRITVNKKKVLGLVVDVSEAQSEKTQIKKAGFSLKKIDDIVSSKPFDPPLMSAVKALSLHYVRPAGTILHALIPDAVLTDLFEVKKTPERRVTFVPDIKLAVMPYAERINRYKSVVREALAKETSVILVCPTHTEVELLSKHIEKGIEARVFVFSGTLTPKKFKERWSKALSHTSPVVIITSGAAISIPRHDIGLFILEHESSPHYKHKDSPYLDGRTVTEIIARHRGCDLIVGDSFPRIETLYRYFTHTISDIARPSLRQEYPVPVSVVDMRNDTQREKETRMSLLSSDAIAELSRTIENKGRSFVFCVRKGFAPFTVCRDCGHVYTCSRCDAPMVLYEGRTFEEGRVFRCGRCGKTGDAKTVCATCRSWRLETYGVGIERVEQELSSLFPTTPLFSVSRDAAPTPVKAKRVFETWAQTSSGILLGTEMALPYLCEHKFDFGLIVSLDTLTFLPDFRMGERVFHIVSQLAAKALRKTLTQTRTPDYGALQFASIGDGLGMYRYEESVRKEFGYPPFTTFIKITRRGKKEVVVTDLTELQKLLSGYTTSIYPAFVSKIKGTHVAHLLISIPSESWPDETLSKILTALPPQYLVDIDPQSLL